eukprot:COSAG01_NODE_11492_length_1922_cov_148.682940_1_plen_20_part_10
MDPRQNLNGGHNIMLLAVSC